MVITQVRPIETCCGPICGTMAELSLDGTFYCLFHGGQRLIAHDMDRMAAHAREGWALAGRYAGEAAAERLEVKAQAASDVRNARAERKAMAGMCGQCGSTGMLSRWPGGTCPDCEGRGDE